MGEVFGVVFHTLKDVNKWDINESLHQRKMNLKLIVKRHSFM